MFDCQTISNKTRKPHTFYSNRRQDNEKRNSKRCSAKRRELQKRLQDDQNFYMCVICIGLYHNTETIVCGALQMSFVYLWQRLCAVL